VTWYTTQPLADVWENPTPAYQRTGRYIFSASYSQTISLLEREIRMLDPDRGWDATHVETPASLGTGRAAREGELVAGARLSAFPC
jgi:hypothetical protein